MKRILFSVVFLLSLTLAQAASAAKSAPEKADREKVSVALQKVVAEETSHAVQELIDTYPDIIELDETFGKLDKEHRILPDYDKMDDETKAVVQRYSYYNEMLPRDLEAKNAQFQKESQDNHNDWSSLFSQPFEYEANGDAPHAQLVKHKDRLFLWEANGHGNEKNVEEYNKILQVLRKENPHARILLALEFLYIGTLNATPIKFYDEKLGDDLYIVESYRKVLDVAREEKIDILALDDEIAAHYTTFSLYKLGDEFAPTTKDFREKHGDRWAQVLGGGYWGVHQRNHQWAQRINAAMQDPDTGEIFYDIVVVWAGTGHYGVKKLLPPAPRENTLDVFFAKLTLTKEEKEAAFYETGSSIDKERLEKDFETGEKLAKKTPIPRFAWHTINTIPYMIYIQYP